MKNNVCILSIISILIVSCNVKDAGNVQEVDSQNIDVLTSQQEIIYHGESNYASFFDSNVNSEVAYGSSREHPLHLRDFNAHAVTIDPSVSGKQLAKTKSVESAPTVLINGKTIEQLNSWSNSLHTKSALSKSSGDLSSASLDEYYGVDVTFSIQDRDVKMYIPQVVEITYPKSHESFYPICYFDKYKLTWDSDSRNTNGVVILIEWDGSTLDKETTPDYIRRIDIVEDTGETTIKKEMFDDIPHLAIVKVTILRGNINIVEVQDVAYKLYASSEASLSTIIAKENLDVE
jgi:hypothetical protein